MGGDLSLGRAGKSRALKVLVMVEKPSRPVQAGAQVEVEDGRQFLMMGRGRLRILYIDGGGISVSFAPRDLFLMSAAVLLLL